MFLHRKLNKVADNIIGKRADMITPSNFPFPFMDNSDSTVCLRSILQEHWNARDADLEAEALAQDIVGSIQKKKPIRIIWEGFGPIEKKLLNTIQTIIPDLKVVGYLTHNKYEETDKRQKPRIAFMVKELLYIDFDFIILADTSLAQKSRHLLMEQSIFKDKIRIPFINSSRSSHLRDMYEKKTDRFLASILKESQTRKIIFFIVIQRGSCPSVELMARSMRNNKQFAMCATYILTDPPENTFDYSISSNGSFQMLAKLLESIPSHLIYIQSHFKWAFLSQFVHSIKPETPIVQEVNDWMETFVDSPESAMVAEKEDLWSCKMIKTIIRCENFLSNHISGFIYKNGGKWMEEKTSTSRTPSLHLLPCQPRKMMRSPQIRNTREEWKLVFAGKVASTKASPSFFDDIKLLPLVKSLTKQKLNIAIWNSPIFNKTQLKIDFNDYYKEDINNSYFQFIPGTSIENIVDKLNGNYDFGLMLYHFNPTLQIGKHHLAGSMATKLFTYIAAGLPILISPELKYMAEFVSKNKIGLVIKRKNICSLKQVLDQCDYAFLSDNITKAQKKYCAENNTDQLLSFFNSII